MCSDSPVYIAGTLPASPPRDQRAFGHWHLPRYLAIVCAALHLGDKSSVILSTSSTLLTGSNNLVSSANFNNIQLLKLADDTKLFGPVSSVEDVDKIMEDLVELSSWSSEW